MDRAVVAMVGCQF